MIQCTLLGEILVRDGRCNVVLNVVTFGRFGESRVETCGEIVRRHADGTEVAVFLGQWL
jgi:hypothetical protein